MTVAQVWMYLAGASDSAGRRTMSPGEARDWIDKRRRQKKNWIRQMVEDDSHGK